jgi:hypothetical protein
VPKSKILATKEEEKKEEVHFFYKYIAAMRQKQPEFHAK